MMNLLKQRLIDFEINFYIMIWDGTTVDFRNGFLLYDIIRKINYFNIIILKRGFSNHTALFIILLSEV